MNENTLDPQDVKMCNCAGCGRELLGLSMREWWLTVSKRNREGYPPFVRGRINDRPYCGACLSASHGHGGRQVVKKPIEEDSPSQANALRELEEGVVDAEL